MILIIENIKGGKAGRMPLCFQMNFHRVGHHGTPLDKKEVRLTIMDHRQFPIQDAAAFDLRMNLG